MCTLKPGVLLTDTEYGMALLDQKSAEYWTLNPTAALVLRELLNGHDAGQAAAALVERYDGVDAEAASQDVAKIVEDLRSAGLITP
ncbi:MULTISPECIES: lasso peptide biosynthesis PqqD family chaperone [Streptomyces]|uniref:Lasso peptide biosynthesis PqqD family chaperone n=1 Tax=Streptomyces amritsarensis TaxID=681158 RepID=A0ABX3FW94_9ACTN|nr:MULTISPECIES: lasso peptide biosynthesis PqqD family chaperone [Streptomyces]AQT70520.1 hypothetical protein B1K54_01060 [Streptomyces sp. fd1-xmd]OLZ44182.1 hypothetical protein AVW11_35045 [Streptomyces amritsarensis]